MQEVPSPLEDEVETERRRLQRELTAEAGERAILEARHGEVWDTAEMQQAFQALSFAAPVVVARRRSDGVLGTLMFQAHPRYYFRFVPDTRETR